MEDASGFFDAEMADGVENPVNGDAEVRFCLFARAFHSFEEWLELQPAPVINHSDRDVDLGMDNPLLCKALHHAIGDEFVVFRRAKALGDGLEGKQESGEVGVLVDGLRLHRGRAGCRRGGGSARPVFPA